MKVGDSTQARNVAFCCPTVLGRDRGDSKAGETDEHEIHCPHLSLLLVVQLNSWAASGPLDEIYRKQGSWQDTVAVTREAFQQQGGTVLPIGSWFYIGCLYVRQRWHTGLFTRTAARR